ncbi:hypothetical protein E2562_038934 [Oryza meyeriana var. granulata]|uniref:Plant heme peroxidase family profile domain-containing protein n=1 Tax=Oryza meyeriana var. granulata TaxID=110450 RepID=A0A6G1E8Z0_9ORYZ|nr:hypothetical protein E2562_038934 [Oryza meyeriana var. granulata]
MLRPDSATSLRFAAVSLILCTANICTEARRSSYALLLDDEEEDGGGGGDGSAYPVLTGRTDSTRSFYDEVGARIPSPNATYAVTLDAFARRGFTERETVALLGAHSIGKVQCRFFRDRIYNFAGTRKPDDTIDADMVEEMRAVCGSDGDGDGAAPMEMGYYRQGREVGFGAHYYAKLLGGRGILRSDQQLTAGSTVRWVRVYASGAHGEEVFREDFAHAMVKLAALEPLTGSPGHVRIRCSKPVG